MSILVHPFSPSIEKCESGHYLRPPVWDMVGWHHSKDLSLNELWEMQDREAWCAAVLRLQELDMIEQAVHTFLPEFCGQRSLVGYRLWGHKGLYRTEVTMYPKWVLMQFLSEVLFVGPGLLNSTEIIWEIHVKDRGNKIPRVDSQFFCS